MLLKAISRGGVTLLLALAAQAATIDSNSVNFSVDADTTTATGSFSKFDPSLGTLTGVELIRTNYSVAQTMAVSISGAGSVSISADFQYLGTLSLSQNGDPYFYSWTGFINAGKFTVSCSASTLEFNSCSQGQPESFNFSDSVIPLSSIADLSPFVGTGNVDFSVDTSNYITNKTSQPGGGSASFDRENATGTLALRYTYDPAVNTPEPATLSLLAVGLAGLGVWSKRKRRV